MKHVVLIPSGGGVEALKALMNVHAYGASPGDEQADGYLQAIGELSRCLVPQLLVSSDENMRRIGNELSNVGLIAWISHLRNLREKGEV